MFAEYPCCRYQVVTFLAVAMLASCLGCGSNDILSKVDNSTDDQPAATSRSAILSMVRDYGKRQKQLVDDMFSALSSITDDASANAAFDRIDKLAKDYQSGIKTKVVYVEMTNEEYGELEKDMLQALKEVRGTPEEAQQRGREIGERIGSTAKLSMHTAMRFRSLGPKFSMLDTKPPFTLKRRYPPDQIVTVVIENDKQAGEFANYIDDKLNLELSAGRFANGVHQIRFGAVDDMDAFASRIDLGKVVRTNSRTRAILVELSADDLAMLEKAKKERQEEQARLAKEREEKAEADRLAREQEKEQRAKGDVESALAKRDKLLDDALRTLKRITTPQMAMDSARTLEDTRRDLQRQIDAIPRAMDSYRRQMNEDYQYEDKMPEMLPMIQAEIDRLNQDTMIRVAMARKFGSNLTARSLLLDEAPFGGYTNPSSDSAHPDYFAANLMDLKYGSSFEKRDALKRLGAADPSKLDDQQLHGEIARAVRDVMTTGGTFQKADALKPLVVWGGKFSVPLVIQMLDEDEGRGSNSDEIFAALATYPTPESAEAVAKYVGNFFAHKKACQCLVNMGPVAEDAVLKIAPSNDAKTSVAAVIILGEIGTEKSLPLLRKAQKSRNEEVKQAAKDAVAKITSRS